MLAVGFGSAVRKPLKQSRGGESDLSEVETWKILEKRFGMKRAREIMDVERWRYREWNMEMKRLKWVFDTETGEWNLQPKR